MPEAKIVQTAQHRPGGDFLTGEDRGPFLDTGLSVGRGKARYGHHIYLSLKHLAPVLRDEGWLTPEDVEDLVERLEALQEQVDELQPKVIAYQNLVETLQEHVEPRVEVREKVVAKQRAPTDEEIEQFISANRSRLLNRIETVAGSEDHYRLVYAGHGYLSGERTPRVTPTTVKSEPAGPEPVNKADPDDNRLLTTAEHDAAYPANDPSVYELQGQAVRLDEVLKGNTKEILAFAEGHPDDFHEALVTREYELGELKGRPHPRKGVIEGLGYEFEAEDESDEESDEDELLDADLDEAEEEFDDEEESEEESEDDEEGES